MEVDTYIVEHDSGAISFPGDALLVAIDETGHEYFADSQHPVFGLGGCAVLLKHIDELISQPWFHLKSHFFQDENAPLHAAGLRNITKEQTKVLGRFFITYPFYRLAVMAASTIQNGSEVPLIQLICRTLWECIARIADCAQPTHIIVVAEESERIKHQVWSYLSGYSLGHQHARITPKLFFAEKSTRQPYMEVADFIMHAAGAQVRNRILGRFGRRRDFDAVFHRADPRLSHYVELLAARRCKPNAQSDRSSTRVMPSA